MILTQYETGMPWRLILFISTPGDSIITKGISTQKSPKTFLTHHCPRNFTQFYSTKSERDRNLRKEYDTQMDYRKHLQAFIDRWRYNANRGKLGNTLRDDGDVTSTNIAAQAQMKIKILEKVNLSRFPACSVLMQCLASRPPTSRARGDGTVQVRRTYSDIFFIRSRSRFPETEKISPPLLQMSEVTFGYTADKIILKGVNIDVGLDSRIAMVGANGAGKSTL